ncbi:MAG: hypothetical protein O2780_03170 [Proteobacteria bacterium]|nr:hypothetical protein [Pseudomonadota bacterium]
MTGFVILFVVVVAVVMLLRTLRRREIAAFRDADLSALENFRIERSEANPERVSDQVEAIATAAGIDLASLNAPVAQYSLRKTTLDEVHQRFLTTLYQILDGSLVVLVKLPLTDFIRTKSPMGLAGKVVSFLICDKFDLAVRCGIVLGEPRARSGDIIEQVFEQIGKPLVRFPPAIDISPAELSDALGPLLSAVPGCPKCGRPMTRRKANRGRNSGQSFWVCSAFPDCNGISRIARA